jgi:hypothetical protein
VKLDVLYLNVATGQNPLFAIAATYLKKPPQDLLKDLENEGANIRLAKRTVKLGEFVDMTCDYDKFPVSGFPVRCKVSLHNI